MNELLQTHEADPKLKEWFKTASLALLKAQLASTYYPKYPSQRLSFANGAEYPYPGSRLHLPLGEWDTGSFPNVPGEAGSARLAYEGYTLDGLGRPLHPWIQDMLVDPAIGVVTGRGFYRNWGANYTGDPLVVRYDQATPLLLLIKRRDTGLWALPGGFVEPGETGAEAALREACEETLIDISALHPEVSEVYSGPLADIRVTANAWPETTAVLAKLDPVLSAFMPTGMFAGNSDEVEAAGWFPIAEARANLFGSHDLLVELALRDM